MLVVLSIIGILSIIVVVSQRTFNRTILLNYTAYDIALSIRSAQTYGLGSRTSAEGRNIGYGVRFASGAPGSFILFADAYPGTADAQPPISCHPRRTGADGSEPDAVPGDCVYQAGQDGLVGQYTIGNGMQVSGLYAYDSNGVRTNSLGSLDIVFARPNTRTYVSSGVGATPSYVGFSRACVTLTSPQGGNSYIHVQPTGEINVNSTAC